MTSISHSSIAAARHRWRPAPFIKLSAWWHAAGAITLIGLPAWWPWVLGALAANHVVLIAAVLWPRGRLLGSNVTRLPSAAAARGEICLTFDDGPDPQIPPQVLDMLDRYGAKASFFCIGAKAADHPDIVKAIVRRGHSVENHTLRHPLTFAFFGMAALRREITAAQAALAGAAGRTPLFFRAPAGFRSPLLDPVLAALDLRYVSWTRRGYDAVNRHPLVVLQKLTRGLVAGDVLMLHDGARARTTAGSPVVLTVLPALLEHLHARGLKSVTLPGAINPAASQLPVAAAA